MHLYTSREIPNFNCDEACLGDLKSSPIRMYLGRSVWMRSFRCDMHWPLLDTYWENSGFGLGGFNIGEF